LTPTRIFHTVDTLACNGCRSFHGGRGTRQLERPAIFVRWVRVRSLQVAHLLLGTGWGGKLVTREDTR